MRILYIHILNHSCRSWPYVGLVPSHYIYQFNIRIEIIIQIHIFVSTKYLKNSSGTSSHVRPDVKESKRPLGVSRSMLIWNGMPSVYQILVRSRIANIDSDTNSFSVSHWNKDVVILMKLSPLALAEVVILTTFGKTSEENIVNMKTVLFDCLGLLT